MSEFEGRCHCGAIGYTYRTALEPGKWVVRACQCSFCRGHNARTTTDREGTVRFAVADSARLGRYRFGSGITDFLICRGCGVYLGAVQTAADGRQFATLNVNAMRPLPEVPAAQAVNYEGESADARRGRRVEHWTPVEGAL